MIKWLENLSKKNFRIVKFTSYIVYFLLMIVGPLLTVLIKYDVFNTETTSKLKLNGWALIILIVIAIVALFVCKKAISKLNDLHPASAYLKYSLTTAISLILPIIALVVIHQMKLDIKLASSTMYWVLGFYIAGSLEDNILISFVNREDNIRSNALMDKEKAKRADRV